MHHDVRRIVGRNLAHQDESLEEIWRIKREIASEYPTLEDYFKGMLAYQEEEMRQGVKFVSFPPRKPEPAMPKPILNREL